MAKCSALPFESLNLFMYSIQRKIRSQGYKSGFPRLRKKFCQKYFCPKNNRSEKRYYNVLQPLFLTQIIFEFTPSCRI